MMKYHKIVSKSAVVVTSWSEKRKVDICEAAIGDATLHNDGMTVIKQESVPFAELFCAAEPPRCPTVSVSGLPSALPRVVHAVTLRLQAGRSISRVVQALTMYAFCVLGSFFPGGYR